MRRLDIRSNFNSFNLCSVCCRCKQSCCLSGSFWHGLCPEAVNCGRKKQDGRDVVSPSWGSLALSLVAPPFLKSNALPWIMQLPALMGQLRSVHVHTLSLCSPGSHQLPSPTPPLPGLEHALLPQAKTFSYRRARFLGIHKSLKGSIFYPLSTVCQAFTVCQVQYWRPVYC